MKDLFTVLKYANVRPYMFTGLSVMVMVASFLNLLPEQLMGYVINELSGQSETSRLGSWIDYLFGLNHNSALMGLTLFFFCSAIAAIFTNFYCYLTGILFEVLLKNLRFNMYSKLLHLDYQTCKHQSKGALIHSLMNDTLALKTVFSDPFYTLFSDLFNLMWISIFLLFIAPTVLLILICIVPCIYVASFKTAHVQKVTAKEARELDVTLTENIEQTLSGYETIKAFNAENYEQLRFKDKVKLLYKVKQKQNKNLAIFFPIESILRFLGVSLVAAYAIWRIDANMMSIGMFAVLVAYAHKFFIPIRNFFIYYQAIQKGVVAASNVCKFFLLPQESQDKKSCVVNVNKLSIEVKNLNLSIQECPVLRDINFTAQAGQLVLLKGRSGSGKSSLFKCLLKLYNVKEGCIFINGYDICVWPHKELRACVAYVAQNPFIHNETLRDNVCYSIGKAHSPDPQSLIIRLGLGHKDVEQRVGEDGQQVSGGELVRIAFARAMMRQANIYLLDEIFSSLDAKNIEIILEMLRLLKQQGALIILSTHIDLPELTEMSDRTVVL